MSMVLNWCDCTLKRWIRVRDALLSARDSPAPPMGRCALEHGELHRGWVRRAVGSAMGFAAMGRMGGWVGMYCGSYKESR